MLSAGPIANRASAAIGTARLLRHAGDVNACPQHLTEYDDRARGLSPVSDATSRSCRQPLLAGCTRPDHHRRRHQGLPGKLETANVAPATLRKYRTFTKKVQVFGDSRGYVMLDQFTATDMDVFYSGSTLGIRAKGKMLEKLRTFFRFAVNREWISKSPRERLT